MINPEKMDAVHLLHTRVKERTWRKLRVEAARRNMSVQQLVNSTLEKLVEPLPEPDK